MNATHEQIQNAAYGQLIALRRSNRQAQPCLEMVTESLMEEFGCTHRRAASIAATAWLDLEDVGRPPAYVDMNCTTAGVVTVVCPTTGRTSIFSARELLSLRERMPATVIRANA